MLPVAFLVLLSGFGQAAQEKEAALGRELAVEFTKQTSPLPSGIVQDYLDRLGARLAPHIPDAAFRFTFGAVAEDPCRTLHEPPAFPGGYVFVSAALFLAAQDEAEFAGMVAHAMLHAVRWRPVRARGSIPLVFMGGWAGACEGQENLVPRAYLATLRRNEEEADVPAVRAMAGAGFDPAALARYMERVQGQPAAARVAVMLEAIQQLPPGARTSASSEAFIAAREEVRRLTASAAVCK